MEKELAEIKERVGKIQKAVEDALGRRPRGAALCGYPFEPLGAWARVEWPLGYQWHEPAGHWCRISPTLSVVVMERFSIREPRHH